MQRLVIVPLKLVLDPATRAYTGEALVEGAVTRVCSLRCNQDTPQSASAEDSCGGLTGVAVLMESDKAGGWQTWHTNSRIRIVIMSDGQSHEVGGWNHLCSWYHDGAPCEVFYVLDQG